MHTNIVFILHVITFGDKSISGFWQVKKIKSKFFVKPQSQGQSFRSPSVFFRKQSVFGYKVSGQHCGARACAEGCICTRPEALISRAFPICISRLISFSQVVRFIPEFIVN